jgi:CheY-like chemotaxis protein
MLSTHYRIPCRPAERDLSLLDVLARQTADWVERTQAESALRGSEQRLRRSFELNPMPMGVWSRDGVLTEANEALIQLLGYTRADLLSARVTWRELSLGDGLAENAPTFPPVERQLVRKDGVRLSALVGSAPFAASPDSGVFFAMDLRTRSPPDPPVDSSTLQLLPESAVRSRQTTALQLEGIRVLIVDDEPDALEVMQRVLQTGNAEVATALSVDEALKALEQQPFHVLLSDLAMPVRDGYELITEVRRRGMQTPAAAVTASTRSEDRARALRSGYQSHVAKPFEPSELLATVAALAGRALA